MTARGLLNPVAHLDGFACLSSLSMPAHLSWNKVLNGVQCDPFSCRSNSARCLQRTFRVLAARKNVSTRKYQQSKSRVTEPPKKLGAVGGAILKRSQIQHDNNANSDIVLSKEQAIGQVITAQANFMRVIVERAGNQELSEAGVHPEILNREDEYQHSGNGHELRQESAVASPKSPEKELELLCVVRNVLKKIGRRVLVGDRVLVTGIDWTEKRGMIEDVVDRKSEIVDPPVANVNHLLVVFSIEQPQIDEKVLSRFLVEVESTDIPFSLVLNKVDLVEPEVVQHWQERLADWGYSPVLCSVDRRLGLSTFTSLLKNKITVILGPSGVGKSSLINSLRDQEGLTLWNQSEEEQQAEWLAAAVDRAEEPMQQTFEEAFEDLRVGEVSAGSGRGRHTTRHVSLVPLPGRTGLLADTPGFSQPSLAKVTSTSLSNLFPEVGRMISESENGSCAFPNCLHVGEPYCAVGDKWDRYSHYLALLEEVRNREKVEKRVLGTKRESELRYKVRADGVKQAEPRLALKKHRRESRKHLNQSLEEEFREEEMLQADLEETQLEP